MLRGGTREVWGGVSLPSKSGLEVHQSQVHPLTSAQCLLHGGAVSRLKLWAEGGRIIIDGLDVRLVLAQQLPVTLPGT